MGTNRILFGPDNKIGANLLQAMKDPKYQQFLPEFPLLHVRKSKINTLFSAYSDAGLVHILMFMCDNEKKDWNKLISVTHIDVAARYVRRLSIAFHLAFTCKFLQTLDKETAKLVLKDLEEGRILAVARQWGALMMHLSKGELNKKPHLPCITR